MKLKAILVTQIRNVLEAGWQSGRQTIMMVMTMAMMMMIMMMPVVCEIMSILVQSCP